MKLQRLLHQDTRAWIAVASLALAMTLLQAVGREPLQYERSGVLAGEAWRLLTGHFVHADWPHLGWNVAGLALVAWLFAREYGPRGWAWILLGSTAAVDLGFLVLEPRLGWYVGFSGVLHGLAAAGLIAWVVRARDWITLVVLAVFALKLGWEHFAGPLPFTAQTLEVPVVHEAHTYGAVGGAIAAAFLLRRERRAAASL